MQNQVSPEENKIAPEKIINQLIVFLAGDEEFGVPIEQVREIIKITSVTPIPNSPNYIKGIINVRGEIVTTIDIKERFSLPHSKKIEAKHIVVTKQDDGLFGLIVDEVIEVLRIQQDEIKPPPSIVSRIHKKYVTGVITHEDRLIILLDLMQVLSYADLLQLENLTRTRIKHPKPRIVTKSKKDKL